MTATEGRKLEITVLSGVSQGDIFRFTVLPDKGIRIGRSPENDLVLQDDMVSRAHAFIELRDRVFYLTDLGSTHGTVLMGFRLTPGDKVGRELKSGDEFKIGNQIFRATFEKEVEKATAKPVEASDAPSGAKRKTLKLNQRQKLIAVAALALVGALLLLMPGGSGGPPRQSNTILSIPQERALGFISGKDKNENDRSHIDKVQLALPASDHFLEFDYQGAHPIDIFIDQTKVGRLESTDGFWTHGMLIVRDPMVGYERKLIFDNTGYPLAKGQTTPDEWAVRGIRATPISNARERDPLALLEAARALTDKIEVAPEGLFNVIRTVQAVILRSLHELTVDASSIDINLETAAPTPAEIAQTLDSLISERKSGLDIERQDQHLVVLSRLLGRMEAELWRRVETRVRNAKLSAKVKDFIEAHDLLLSAIAMIPEESDRRVKLAQKVFDDPKIVPKSVKKKPEKYRERAAAAAAGGAR